MSQSQSEPVRSDLACQFQSIVTAALYVTLNDQYITHILKLTESPIIFCDASKIEKIITLVKRQNLTRIKVIVCFDCNIDKDYHRKCLNSGIKLVNFDQLIEKGKSNPNPFNPKLAGLKLSSLKECYLTQHTLRHFEKNENFEFYIDEFMSTGNDSLTSTLKIKRNRSKELLKDSIDLLYKEGPLVKLRDVQVHGLKL
ncbi:hypothetical protein WICPIJ_005859 [Wickerhamomyces pijperi]|uniref:Uncharacterized protein n=1 Tax=Wickerhamomyces pijperi TaxID=599730 RepID=A0A9P8Q2T6_WICPI|nr:hypothetical protein WICPIJ_005859 [Wickerhamomyces pijperi]